MVTMLGLLGVIAAIGSVLLVRLWMVVHSIRAKRTPYKAKKQRPSTQQQTKGPLKTLVVLGSGGHTTEMLHLIKHLDPSKYDPIRFIVATTDTTSERRVLAFAKKAETNRTKERSNPTILTPLADPSSSRDYYYKIPRSREVGQSYITSVATTLWSFVYAVLLVARIRPDVLLCNGPGTCLPIAIVTFAFRILGYCNGNIVFVESFCRVTRYARSALSCGLGVDGIKRLAVKL